jgi:hypothetical protein
LNFELINFDHIVTDANMREILRYWILISLEIFYSRPLNSHMSYLVCVVNIMFCCVFVFCLSFRS